MAIGAVVDATPSQYNAQQSGRARGAREAKVKGERIGVHMHTLNKLLGKSAWVTPMAIGAVVDATPSQYELHEVQVT